MVVSVPNHPRRGRYLGPTVTAPRDPSSSSVRPRRAPLGGPPDVPVATVVAARRGDPAAFARIVEHWDDHLRPFVHHALGGDGSTDRVLAAAYVRAYRALPRYDAALTPGLWLHRIAYLSATDELRRLDRDRARRWRSAEELMADAAADDEAVRRRTAATGSTGAGGSGRAADDRDPDLWAPIDTPDPAPPDAEPYRIVATPIPAAEPGVDERSDPREGDPLDGSADPVADGDLAHPGPDAATPGDPAAPPGWSGLGADQRALAVMVDLEGFTVEAAADAFDTTQRVVLDRLGSARRVLSRAGSRDASAKAASSARAPGPSAVSIVEAPAPQPVTGRPGRPGQVGGAATLRAAGDGAGRPAPDSPVPPEWTTTPGDEIEEVRLVALDDERSEASDNVDGRDDGPSRSLDDSGIVAATTIARRVAEDALGTEDLTAELVASSRQALKTLQVPPPGGRFWADLGRRLLAEREAPAAPALDPLARLAKAHPAEPGFHPREKKGRLRRSRGEDADLTSAAVTSLADQADWVRPRRRWARTIGVLALLAMVGGLVYIAVRIGTSGRVPDGTRAGGEVADEVADALGTGPFTQVDATVEVPTVAGATAGGTTSRRSRIVIGADGSWAVSSLDRIDQTTYDTASGTQRRVAVVGDGETQSLQATEVLGLAAGRPDPSATAPEELADLQAVVPLLRSAPGRAEAQTISGRKVWVLRRAAPTGPAGAVETWRIIVSRENGQPLTVERRSGDQLIRRTRWSLWRLRQSVPADTFDPPAPTDVEVAGTTGGFSTTDLAAVPLLGRGPAVTAGWLPTGFELATVTVRDEPLPDAPTTGGGANPVDRKVMSLGFRRGPLSITVTTRAGGDDPTAWRDPFVDPGSPATPPDAPETRTVTDGRYNGLVVTIASDADGRTHLWGVTDVDQGITGPVVLTVDGDLTPDQAYRLAASLR